MHRLYPNADRALRQLDRHGYETPPLAPPRPATTVEQQLAAISRNATEVLRAAQPSLATAMRALAAFQPPPRVVSPAV
jgi:hypothetical protein